jgi:multidrug efflux pump subunit AcrA (membrane-fusion protein)
VRAPDAGVISARQATVGSVVGAGTELFRLIRQGRIEWRAEVTAAEIGRIQVGAPVQVKAASGQVLQGKVRMVAPSVDAQTRNAIVYVDLPAATGSARAGMYAQGDIGLGQSRRSPCRKVPWWCAMVSAMSTPWARIRKSASSRCKPDAKAVIA